MAVGRRGISILSDASSPLISRTDGATKGDPRTYLKAKGAVDQAARNGAMNSASSGMFS